MQSLAECYVKDDEFVSRSIAGEAIIVPVKGRVVDLDSICTLNEVATRIWELLDGRTSVGQIVDDLRETYEVTAEQATKDTIELLSSLETVGLIHREVGGLRGAHPKRISRARPDSANNLSRSGDRSYRPDLHAGEAIDVER